MSPHIGHVYVDTMSPPQSVTGPVTATENSHNVQLSKLDRLTRRCRDSRCCMFDCELNTRARVFLRLQAVAAAVQAGAARHGPGAGQGEDAGGQEIQHSQIGAGGVPPCYAAPQ